MSPRYSWTQPSCDDCWQRRYPGRQAVTIKQEMRDAETCCFCGEGHRSGIYVRVDPETVPYPSIKKD